MIKKIEYKVPITRSEVIGEETKYEDVKCCDRCGAYQTIYIELEFITGKWMKSKPTGRESPCRMFHHYTTKGNNLSECFQCHDSVCKDCTGYNDDIWNTDGEHIAHITLCKPCNAFPSESTKNLIELINKKQVCQALLDNISEEIIKKYEELK